MLDVLVQILWFREEMFWGRMTSSEPTTRLFGKEEENTARIDIVSGTELPSVRKTARPPCRFSSSPRRRRQASQTC